MLLLCMWRRFIAVEGADELTRRAGDEAAGGSGGSSRTGVGLKTFIRLAYKSYQMKIPYSKEDPDGEKFMNEKEKFFSSHKEKIEEMNAKWENESPFLNYNVISKQRAFYLEKITNKIDCKKCKSGRANKNCVQSFCKKCCVGTNVKCTAHQTKKKDTTEGQQEET